MSLPLDNIIIFQLQDNKICQNRKSINSKPSLQASISTSTYSLRPINFL